MRNSTTLRLMRPAIVSLAAIAIAACEREGDPPAPPSASATQYAETGWTTAERRSWYWNSQGSRLIPGSWFRALEVNDGTAKFATTDHLVRYGFVVDTSLEGNGLPVGFAYDSQDDDGLLNALYWYDGQQGAGEPEPWMGLNCAACHTAEITHEGKRLRIDGGPGMADFQTFIEDLDRAMVATRGDPAKWERFAASVLGARDSEANRQALQDAVDAWIAWQEDTDRRNFPAGDDRQRYGYARVDAFGHIYNKVLMFAGGAGNPGNASDAPVSYPFLWNIHKQKKVQWNGAAENSEFRLLGQDVLDYGALGRNAGEVLGVFGDLDISSHSMLRPGYASSLNINNLNAFELYVRKLSPPKWPAFMPLPDNHDELAAEGAELFRTLNCNTCHKTPDMQREGEPTEVMLPFQRTDAEDLTDIWMACNAFDRRGPSGLLRGTRSGFLNGEPFGPRADVGTMLAASVKGALVRKGGDVVKVGLANIWDIDTSTEIVMPEALPPAATPKEQQRARCMTTDNPALAYKARPLDGIWATAPYLHNGSVPTLYHLLLPAAQRPREFYVGSREYDPVLVGYKWQQPPAGPHSRFVAVGTDGRPIDGNGNQGHEYGVENLTEPQRMALLAYLKTL